MASEIENVSSERILTQNVVCLRNKNWQCQRFSAGAKKMVCRYLMFNNTESVHKPGFRIWIHSTVKILFLKNCLTNNFVLMPLD